MGKVTPRKTRGARESKTTSIKSRPKKPLVWDYVNKFFVGNAVRVMQAMPARVLEFTVTGPPCGDLRDYKGYRFDAEDMLRGLYRVIKQGGVVVWVAGDRINRGKSLTSFEHAFIGRAVGFTVHDVVVYKKRTHHLRGRAPIQTTTS